MLYTKVSFSSSAVSAILVRKWPSLRIELCMVSLMFFSTIRSIFVIWARRMRLDVVRLLIRSINVFIGPTMRALMDAVVAVFTSWASWLYNLSSS